MFDASSGWQALAHELARWRAQRRTATLWWRDDDAARDVPALRTLLELARQTGTPLALAVIPQGCEPPLRGLVSDASQVAVVQHGYAHRNHAGAGERSAELAAGRELAACMAELERGRRALEQAFDDRFVPIMVPPWNRIDRRLVDRLGEAGYRGLSCFGPRAEATPAPGVVQVNAHVDLVAWKRGRAFIGEEAALARLTQHLAARREGSADDEPTGILTHHLDLSAAAWVFLRTLIERSRTLGAAWLPAAQVFRVPANATFARSA